MTGDREQLGVVHLDGDKRIDPEGHVWEWNGPLICWEHKHAECAMNNGKECTP